jgi:thimet oligopeptidase
MRVFRTPLLAMALATAFLADGSPMAAQAGRDALTPATGASTADVTNDPFWVGMSDLAAFREASAAHLSHAQTILDRLVAVSGPRTVANTLRPYDDIQIELGLAQGRASLVSRLHPDDRFREAADQIVQQAASFQAALNLNPHVHAALSRLDLSRADAETRHYVKRELQTLELAGADKDETVRRRLQTLREQLTAATQEFERNVRTGSKTIAVSPALLEGLPADFIARRPADASGLVTLTTGDADARTVLTYAPNAELRRQMYVALNTIGYPVNSVVIRRVLAIRGEIARLAGYPTWAEYDVIPRMTGSTQAVGDFIDRVAAASEPKLRREFDLVLKRKQRDVPGATTVSAAENIYYADQVRQASYDFDSQRLRPYLGFESVKRGVLDIAGRLFELQYRPVTDVAVWHPSVEVYELVDNGRVAGRFYLDLHPRPAKRSSGATVVTVRKGVGGRQIPEVVLVAAFPGGQPNDPGLMMHDEVKIFFHEFGHVVQNLLASRRPWIGLNGSPAERDFNEAPSQMLEEWPANPAMLARFAVHHQTNEPIPAALVEQMHRASEFGQALDARAQISNAKLALSLHDRDPHAVDPPALARDVQRRYTPYELVDGTHFETRFTHLTNANYGAWYYTYMWSKVIAKDLFSRFDPANLLAPDVARRYRDTVLVPGASRPAGQSVREFLGRPFNFGAWEKWLNAGS